MKAIIPTIAAALALSISACSPTTTTDEQHVVVNQQQNTIDSLNLELAKHRIIDSMAEVARLEAAAVPAAVVATTTTRSVASKPARSSSKSTVRKRSYSGYTQPAYTPANNTPQPVVVQQTPEEPKKKGWSAKAKGAVIGAGAGAAGGAIINKRNRAAGAVIGGVVGAGVGTGIGAIIDKKKGR